MLAVCTLFLVVAGASVTSNQAGLSVPDWPLSYGQVMPEMKDGVFYEHGHRMIASGVGFLTIILALWLWKSDDRVWMRNLGLAALLAVIAQGILGGMTVLFLLPKAISVSHACLAQIFFSTTVAIALFTSAGWRQGPVEVEDSGWPSLRMLALVLPPLVLMQIALGAAYRHRALGIMPHVIGAILIGTFLLMVAVFVLVQFGSHPALRRCSLWLISITFFQILLGVVAYAARISTLDAPYPMPVMVVSTVLHVATGALTMASSVLLSLQILRHVRPQAVTLAASQIASRTR